MRKRYWILFYLIPVLCLTSCQNEGIVVKNAGIQTDNLKNNADGVPVIRFDSTSYNFGKVYEGEKVGWYFKFKNTGNKNLVLKNVSASCGCTVPEYKAEPVLPGGEGDIKVVFDTEGRTGYQLKTITVETNGTPQKIELVLTATVVKK